MQKGISILGVPIDLGKSNRGADRAPEVIRESGLLKSLEPFVKDILDLGDMAFSTLIKVEKNLESMMNAAEIEVCFSKVSDAVSGIIKEQRFPLVLGGDHSIAIGTIAGIAKHYKRLGVLWIDAHVDANTPETSESGCIYGMPAAVNLGFGCKELVRVGGYFPKIRTEDIVYIGTRDVDAGEKDFLKRHGLQVYSMKDVQNRGIERITHEALGSLMTNCDGIHLSFDIDSMDPQEAPGVRTPCDFGLSFEECRTALKALHSSGKIVSAEFVEFYPHLDRENKTADMEIGLINTLLTGK
ncbi:MAG: arginase [Clostridia bacterium]|nr:arginase [Clostridia bacterium]